MYKILTLNKISSNGTSLLDINKYKFGDNIENPEGILLRSFSMHDMVLPNSLMAVARAGAGVNNIPLDKCTEKGIVVFNTPGANANAVKELVIAGLLLSSRDIVGGIEWAKSLSGNGEQVPSMIEKGKGDFAGPEIQGKTLGVIGLGAIGVMVANAANALGMSVIGYDPYISIDAAWGLSHNVKKALDLKYMFENSDYITIHVPLNSETKELINAETIAMMKRGVRILNFARGELVNIPDIKAAINDGIISKYVTDFATDELLRNNKIIAIPHLGASTPESEENCADMAVRQLREYLENGNIINSVNFPNVELIRSSDVRVVIAHKNVPNMLGQISSVFAREEINIVNMFNKSRKDLAYTMVDIDEEINEKIVQALNSIDGVMRVRVIK